MKDTVPPPKTEPKVTVVAKVGQDVLRRLDEMARKEQRTRSQMVHLACAKYVQGK